jgi:hypothetical protein
MYSNTTHCEYAYTHMYATRAPTRLLVTYVFTCCSAYPCMQLARMTVFFDSVFAKCFFQIYLIKHTI